MRGILINEGKSSSGNEPLKATTYFRDPIRYSAIDKDFSQRKRTVKKSINIAFVNNMQGASNAATECYFRKLLMKSAGECPVRMVAFSPLPDLEKRSPDQMILEQLYNFEPDALIVTGMEPTASDLRNEPLWTFMSKVFDWTENSGIPTILSCLAAHAAVLHNDGIARIPLKEKRFGVFEHRVISEHMLTRGLPKLVRVPHSRWNELNASHLIENGYQVLSCSDSAGVDIFVKQRRSLFVHFQGHMEYAAETLCNEYKRDVRRFLSCKRDAYPSMPQGYFNNIDETALDAFREKALKERNPELWKLFPIGIGPAEPVASWDEAARIVFHNLLNYVREANN